MRSRNLLHLLPLALLIALLGLPRFDRADYLIDSVTTAGMTSTEALMDAGKYIGMVEYFRGEAPASVLRSPWAYRPLSPVLVSVLPFRPLTGINILNLLALIGAMLLLYHIQRDLGVGHRTAWFGCLMFSGSFPTLFYSTIGYVDPVLIFFLTAGLYNTVRQNWGWAILMLALGTAAKEAMLIFLPVLGVALLLKEPSEAIRYSVLGAGVAIWVAIWFAVRAIMPVPDVHSEFVWDPSFIQLAFNGGRFRAWATLVLTFGLPGLLVLYGLYRSGRTGTLRLLPSWPFLPLAVGMAGALLLYAYAWTTVYIDGRALWPLYPFAVPAGTWLFERVRNIETT